MTTTSLETSRAIYEALGWDNTEYYWLNENGNYFAVKPFGEEWDLTVKDKKGNALPAYDLDYLLQWLPPEVKGNILTIFPLPIPNNGAVDGWQFEYQVWTEDQQITTPALQAYADTPTEAAGKLVLALVEAGVLVKEQNHGE